MAVDAHLTDEQRTELLKDVRAQLPLWLQRAATPTANPLGEVVSLLGLPADDIRHAQAVHVCVSDEVAAFTRGLPAALRAPQPATDRPRETGQAVRGPIDWGVTARLHAGGQPATYVTRPRRRVFDTPEHRSLAWAISRLESNVARALGATGDDIDGSGSLRSQLLAVRESLRMARRIEWLRDIPAERPGPRVRQRLARSRSAFIRRQLAPCIERLLLDDTLDGDALARLLSKRYFLPERDWRLFEVAVLIRIDAQLAAVAVGFVRRLLSEEREVAVYQLADGDQVRLRYQGWPSGTGGASVRQATGKRHGIDVGTSRPDIMVERSGADPDRLVLELKASDRPGTLGDGLSQLLGYLHERPGLFTRRPAGWLVCLPFDQLQAVAATGQDELWITDAEAVAAAVRRRMTRTKSA